MDFVGSPLLEATGLRILSPLDGGPPPGGIILPLPRAWPRRFVRGHRLRAFVLFCFFLRPAVLLRVLPRLPAKTCPTSGQATGTAVSVDFVLATPPDGY